MYEEIWKDVVGYEGYYQVSNKGNVRSLIKWNGHRYIKRDKPYILRQSNTTTGYKKVELTKEGTRKSKKVHRLVAKSFIPKIQGKDLINHKDGNPINNNMNNLEWCTQSENMYHAYELGLIPKKVTENMEYEIINDYFKGVSLGIIQKKHSISKTTIYKVLENNNKKTQGSSVRNNKYKIDQELLIEMIVNGESNREIAEYFNCKKQLIATYKYKLKKEGKI